MLKNDQAIPSSVGEEIKAQRSEGAYLSTVTQSQYYIVELQTLNELLFLLRIIEMTAVFIGHLFVIGI